MSCLYDFNARWYDPTLGRFITEDPIKDGINFYAYAYNNPLRFTDPTGLFGVDENGNWVQNNRSEFETPEEMADQDTPEEIQRDTDKVATQTQMAKVAKEHDLYLPKEAFDNWEMNKDPEPITDGEAAETAIALNDNLSTAAGIVNSTAEGTAAGVAGGISAGTGFLSVGYHGKKTIDALEKGDDLGALYSGADTLASASGLLNPYVGVTVGLYSKGIIKTAEVAAETTVQINNNPIGFIEALYNFAAGGY